MTETPEATVISDLLEQAIEKHRGFAFEEAEALYRAVLAREPAQADALHNLGVLYAIGLGRPMEALPHFEAALNVDAGRSQFWFSYVDGLIRAEQQDVAAQVLALARAHGLPTALANGLAERLTRTAAVPAPPVAGAGQALSAAPPLQDAGGAGPVSDAVQRELVALFHSGDVAEGERQVRVLLQQHPDSAFLWKALGTMLQAQGRKQEALTAKLRSVALCPDDVEALCNLGRTQFDLGDNVAAAQVLHRAVALAPDHAEAHHNLGLALGALGQVTQAHRCFERALEIRPDFAEGLSNLSGSFTAQGRVAEAVDALRRSLAIKPDNRIAFDNLLFVLNYHPDLSAAEIRQAYADFDNTFGLPQRHLWRAHANLREPGRRLKVGYVSPDFCHHACTFFLEPLLQGHDRAAVEVFAYAEMRTQEDAVTKRYRRHADHWRSTEGLSARELAEQIRADGIDILVDVAGHTRGNRLDVFALKPAPVSLSWMGYGYTTGLQAIDYYLTDAVSVPPGSEHLFSERPWRLPAAPYTAYRPGPGMGEPGPLPALRNGYVTLGTLTRGVRVNPHCVRVWAELLRRIDGARLVIDSKSYEDPALAEALVQAFEAQGIARARLSVGFHSPPWEVLRGIDIGLDCFPHNSGTTLFESLYMGVPIVTLAGRPSVGRIGSAILTGLGRTEWIADDERGYVDRVVALAADLPALARERAGLRARMQASALMDEAGFVREVEQAYRAMFAQWCAQQPAASDGVAQAQAQPLYEQANALHDQGQVVEAERLLRRALALHPDHAEAWNNLGLILQQSDRSQEAADCYRAALRVRPTYALAHHNLGNLLQHHGALEEAVACYERALALGLASQHLYDNLLFLLNYHPTLGAAEIHARYGDYERLFGAPQRVHWQPHRNARRLSRRLRIGYVSPDLRQHACRYFVEPLLAGHDKTAVEVFAYAELQQPDAVTQRYQAVVDHWVPTVGLSDAQLADRIRADRIDVLVDLAGHTRGNRLAVFARKPAPVSVSWMGYGSTTGLAAIDYFLTDVHCAPAQSDALFSETPWRLATPYAVYRPDPGMGDCGPLPALRNGYVTLGSLSRSIRLNDALLDVWARVLQRLPDARLVVDSRNFADPAACDALLARLESRGIARARLALGHHSPPWDVLRGIDIGLDCFPHNSGTTLFESLYLGVPCVTLAGRPSVGRIGSAILHGLGRPQWIADSADAYVEKVVALARDLPALAALRAGLRAEMQASALMDERRFVQAVEQAYRAMFARWANMAPAQPMTPAVAAEPAPEDLQRLSTLFRERRYEEGATLARTLTERFPDNGFAFKALGVMLQPLGRDVEALSAKTRAAQLLPDDPEAQCNLGMLLQSQNRLAQAEAVLQRALALRPQYREAHNNLAITYQKQGRHDASLAHFQQALALDPGHEDIYSNMLFTLNYHPDLSAEQIFAHYREYDRRFGQPWRSQWQRHANARDTERRLRVGYVSPDFRSHACQRFLEPLLAAHDKAAVEVYAYAELAHEDAVTQRYRALVDHWVPTRGMRDAELAQRVRADRIDVLVDLAGHTVGNRLGVFARKPAPVSLSWLGYGYTSGLSSIDYFLTDAASAPDGCEDLFAETPWRLPVGWCFRPDPGMGEPGPLPALARGHVTLGTLTRGVRINAHTLRVWAEILHRLPGAHLVVDSGSFSDGAAQQSLRERFAALGIAPERLQVGYHSPPWDLLRSIDIGLDCFPHNSGTTLFETLYMGVPYVSLAGRPSVGRLGSSILQGAGCAEWIASDERGYVERVVALASDLPALARVRQQLRGRMQASALMDEAGFARAVEQGYRQMFAAWCAGSDHPLEALVARAQALYNEGNRLHDDGQLAPAESCYRRALGYVPEFAEAHANLGLLLQQQGRVAEALQCYREAAALQPESATAQFNLGACLQAAGEYAAAETCLRATLALQPGLQRAMFALDRVLKEQGRAAESETHWRQLLLERPDFAIGYRQLADVLRQQQRNEEALACLLKAGELEPETAPHLQALALVYRDLGRMEDAERQCRRALELEPASAMAWSALAELCNALQRWSEAEAGFRRAIALDPALARAHGNLGIVLQNQGRLAEAEVCMRQALALNPDDRVAHGNLLFVLNYHPDRTGAQVFEEYRNYEQRFFAPLRSAWRPHANAPLALRSGVARRLKIGYVSPDFRQHSVVNFLEPLLARHDRSVVEVYAYAELQREDGVTQRYKHLVEHWIPTVGLGDAQLAERIRADGIDILVDLAGHTGGNRLGVFARKPAPVSLSWMGYGYTTGLSAIDYFLTDAASAPPGSEAVFAERPWRLPVGWAYRPAAAAHMGEPGPLPALRNGHVTFGTLTRAVRINAHTVRVWCALLQRVPGARLRIDSTSFRDAETQEALAARFVALGVERERLLIGCHTPPWDLLRDVDIGLDCFPHNSGTTLFETLYMGVPFVTLAGRPSVGCLGSSILVGLGHPEWIARTEQEYLERAAALAADLPQLAALRAALRGEMQASPLMDEVAFAREVEGAYRQMFQRWEQENKP